MICKTPLSSIRWPKADRTSAWALLGVSRRRVGFLAPFCSVKIEWRCIMSSITSSAVRFIPAAFNFSSIRRRYVIATTHINRWHLILLSVQCRIGCVPTKSSFLLRRKRSSTCHRSRLAWMISFVVQSVLSVIMMFLSTSAFFV